MKRTIYLNGASIETDFSKIDIKKIITNREGFLWVDLTGTDEEEISLLSDIFEFHQLSIEDCIFPQYQSKLEIFENYFFVATHGIGHIQKNSSFDIEKNIVEVDFFLGKNYIVSVHNDEFRVINNVFEKTKLKPQLYQKNFELLMYDIFDAIANSLNPLIQNIEEQVDIIQDLIMEDVDKLNIKDLFNLKRMLLQLRRIIEPQLNTFSILSRESGGFLSKRAPAYFRDIYFYIQRLDRMIDSNNQIMSSSMEVYYSSVSAKLNNAIKFLTILATIALPPLFIVSYYGMNVQFPEQKLGHYHILAVWLFMIILTGVILFILKRKKII